MCKSIIPIPSYDLVESTDRTPPTFTAINSEPTTT